MTELLEVWWPLAVAAVAFLLLERIPYFVGGARVRRADSAAPLDVAAGRWLEQKLRDREIAEEIRVHTDEATHEDAYFPHHRAISLQWPSFASRRASARALAARSLAWATGDLDRAWFFLLVLLARALGPALLYGCAALVLGNTLFAIPLATTIAFGLLIGAAVCQALLVVSEVLTTRDAEKLLTDGGSLSDEQLSGCRRVLNAPRERAFVHLVAIAAALAGWGWIAARVGNGVDGSSGALEGARQVAAAIAAALVAIRGLFYALELAAPSLGNRSPGLVTLLAPFGLFVLLALAWDLSAAPSWHWLVLLAFVPALRWIELAGRLLFAAIFLIVWGQLARFSSRRREVPREELPEYESAEGKTLRGGDEDPRLALALALHEQPREERWLESLTKGLALPMAVAFWFVAHVI